jgi:short-subunit dehydrogenase
METNFFGVLRLTRALLPTFRVQGNGRIVLVSSEAAFMGQPTNSIYCSSKWAIEGWAEAIAYELEPFGIEVILIEPGPYRTEIWKSTPRIQPPGSPYHAWVQQVFRAGDAHAASVARDPKEVAIVIARAPAVLLSRRPLCPPLYERQGAKSSAAQSNGRHRRRWRSMRKRCSIALVLSEVIGFHPVCAGFGAYYHFKSGY